MANKIMLGKLADAGIMSASDAVRMSDYKATKPRARGFDGAKVSHITAGMSSGPKPIDVDIRNGLRLLKARARNEAMNNDHVRRFLGLLKTNVVGHQGFALQARVVDPSGKSDKLANDAIEKGWAAWGKKGACEVTGRMSWKMSCRQFIETVARDGEVLARKIKGWKGNKFRFALQFLDTELLDVDYNHELKNGNVIRMSVELDGWRKPVAYHLIATKQTADSYVHMGKKYVRIPAEEIIHEFLPEWAWQTRGFPWMASSLLRLNMLAGYEESELVASRVASSKMGFFERTEEGALDPANDIGPIGTGQKDSSGNFIDEATPGSFDILPDGYKVSTFDPQHPSTAYGDFVKSCLRGIAAGLGVSYNSLAGDLENVNYNSLRKGAIDDNAVWMLLQDWMIESFIEPVYLDWLRLSLLANALTVNGSPLKTLREEKYQAVTWQPRRWEWVDPLKAMNANEKAIAHKVRSPQSVIREMGGDPDQVLDECARWQEMLDERGLVVEVVALSPPAPAVEEDEPPEDQVDEKDDKKQNA